ncbi:hypothetical protein LTR50_003085 [Elasticomyces elasticus]|nr:hypothetical protein LTR50_003085 [Elasticomyces elasticus]
MDAYAPNASREVLEDELAFQHVVLDSVRDRGDDENQQKEQETRETIRTLEQRLGISRPTTGHSQSTDSHGFGGTFTTQMDAMDNSASGLHAIMMWPQGFPSQEQQTPPTLRNAYLSPNAGGSGASSSTTLSGSTAFSRPGSAAKNRKRPRPQSTSSSNANRSAKRQTPTASTPSTPASMDSLELLEQNHGTIFSSGTNVAKQRLVERQRAAESAAQQRMAAEKRDSQLAAFLQNGGQWQNQNGAHNTPTASRGAFSSFARQSTIPWLPSGPGQQSFTLAPQDSSPISLSHSTPRVKHEMNQDPRIDCAGPPRNAGPPDVIDLTGDSDNEVGNTRFTVVRAPVKSERPVTQPYPVIDVDDFRPMPGSYPSSHVMDPFAPGTSNMAYSLHAQLASRSPLEQLGSWTRDFGSHVSEHAKRWNPDLHVLDRFSKSGPFGPRPIYDLDDDDDILYAGLRRSGGEPLRDYTPQDLAQNKEDLNKLLDNIKPDVQLAKEQRIKTPWDMACELMEHQKIGLQWMMDMEKGTNKGGILADDMGLGKTVQALALIHQNKSTDPRRKTTLIVAPVALMRQWKTEIQEKTKPGPRSRLRVFVHHGQTKRAGFRELRDYDVVLTTYGSLAAEHKRKLAFEARQRADPSAQPTSQDKLALIGEDCLWYRVILDEAQCIKNRSTKTALGAYDLQALSRFCMTGTPMMNNVEELYSLIHFLRIKPYCRWEKFNFDFARPLKTSGSDGKEKAMVQLQAVLKAILLRRLKKSEIDGHAIIEDLPERTTEESHAVFDKEQQAVYTALETKSRITFNKYLKAGAVGRQYTAVLVLLLRLRQACCHPHLISDLSVSSSLDISADDMVSLAERLSPQVINRIKETEAFECPVCYDAVENPAIFLPCGHDVCGECNNRILDPAQGIQNGDAEGSSEARCPTCRGKIDAKMIIDYNTFCSVHCPEKLKADANEVLDDARDSDSSTESDVGDEEEEDETLGGFIVKDEDCDSAGEANADGSPTKELMKPIKAAGSSTRKSKKAPNMEKDANGREPVKKPRKTMTLAELKKAASRNTAAKQKYLRRLRRNWVSSAKIDKTLELLTEIHESKDREKTIVFSQWTSLLDLLEVPIHDKGWGYRRYDGSLSPKLRADAVDAFKSDPDVRLMLVSLKAGNAGLNLTAASQVIILDPFWNPYIEEQAIDRAHRIGQTRVVRVHRILVENTVEDRIIALQERKRQLISEALDEKASEGIARLGVEDLKYLFGVRG